MIVRVVFDLLLFNADVKKNYNRLKSNFPGSVEHGLFRGPELRIVSGIVWITDS